MLMVSSHEQTKTSLPFSFMAIVSLPSSPPAYFVIRRAYFNSRSCAGRDCSPMIR
jgi:hypothetical protein